MAARLTDGCMMNNSYKLNSSPAQPAGLFFSLMSGFPPGSVSCRPPEPRSKHKIVSISVVIHFSLFSCANVHFSNITISIIKPQFQLADPQDPISNNNPRTICFPPNDMARTAVPAFIPCHPPYSHPFPNTRQSRPHFHRRLHCRYSFPSTSVMAYSARIVLQDCHCLLLPPVRQPATTLGKASFP